MTPGVYEHYKGGLYVLLFTARDDALGTPLAVYVALDKGHEGSINVRPIRGNSGPNTNGWTDLVTWPDGRLRERFCFLRSQLDS